MAEVLTQEARKQRNMRRWAVAAMAVGLAVTGFFGSGLLSDFVDVDGEVYYPMIDESVGQGALRMGTLAGLCLLFTGAYMYRANQE